MNEAQATAERIKEIAKAKNISLYNICKNSGIPASTFNGIIYGKNKSINTNTLYSIIRTLNMELYEFLDSPLFSDENLDI